jgi:hypothetical protein
MKTDTFDRRELKPYAEPVSEKELNEGSIYFFVNYLDDAMLLPTMEPVVFIGRNLGRDDSGVVYFQDIDSHRRGVRYGSATEDEQATFYSGSQLETGHVFKYEQGLDELIRCSLRRRKEKLE